MDSIKTKRLLLCPSALADANDIQAYFNDWEIIKWMRPPAVPWPYPEDGAVHYLNGLKDKPAYHSFSILLSGSDKVIGTIRFEHHEEKDLVYAMRGFTLNRQHWGKGLMREAADALNEHIFTKTDIKEIRANNTVGNIASSKIKQKQGFICSGIFEVGPPYHSGSTQEEKWFLSKDNWEKPRKSRQ